MSNENQLSVEKRVRVGKGPVRDVRAEGFVPGIYYDAKGENIPVKVREVPLTKLYEKVGKAHVFTLKIESEGQIAEKPVFIWQISRHAYKKQIMHVDFYGVDLNKPIRVMVPVNVTGKAPGLILGGVVQIFRDKIELECLPLEIPETVTVDVSSMNINDTVHISSLPLPQGVKAVYGDDNFAVVGVVPPASETEAEAGAGEAAPAAGA
ncbi:LSU ribosomal protein L25P [Desulfocurvibacter africanus PCS]|uniref:Large ribosomal subunit protein bL25 n=1 Tax=Desulfocurvibacter africanus PCS TaxID=1262666 RepID=M5Q2L5_DESAF|nr:50S ribosomal protein L25/general stress protein Ctc [Desulfocurvibacter africanus]EMG38571.1 LSU ribosomal protein L25P [Desulfocurvibacter africanus PCS]